MIVLQGENEAKRAKLQRKMQVSVRRGYRRVRGRKVAYKS